MMKGLLVLLLSLFFVQFSKGNHCITEEELQNVTALRALFDGFKKDYNKSYTAEEDLFRWSTFQDNMKMAYNSRLRNPTATFGVNSFADTTVEEFKKYYMSSPSFNFERSVQEARKKGVRPATMLNYSDPESVRYYKQHVQPNAMTCSPDKDTYDWCTDCGACTPVYNQGQCGSCWTFGTTETLESYWALAGHPVTSMAMQQILDCDQSSSYGCNGGNPEQAYAYIYSNGGLDSFASYPYVGTVESCNWNPSSMVASIYHYWQLSDEQSMYNHVASAGPLAIAIAVDEAWMSYTGGVITNNFCGPQIDHVVQLTGYQQATGQNPVWNVRNEWGTGWGMSGWCLMAAGQNTCGITSQPTFIQPYRP